MINIFLDDFRNPSDCFIYMKFRSPHAQIYNNEQWIIVRNYYQFVECVVAHHPNINWVSFDHDLAEEHYNASMNISKEAYDEHLKTCIEKTGYDCAKFLFDWYKLHPAPFPNVIVHSMNPIGTQNIESLWEH